MTSERGVRDYAAMSVADQSTVQMMMIVADSFLVAREKRGEFKELTDVGMPTSVSSLNSPRFSLATRNESATIIIICTVL